MELHEKGWPCVECEKQNIPIVEHKTILQTYTNSMCKECIMKMYLLINPIVFDKQKVNEWLMMNVISDDNSANEEGMSEGLYSFDVKHFIDFVKPFLESK